MRFESMILPSDPSVWLQEMFVKAGLSYNLSLFLSTLALVVTVILLSWLSNVVAKAVINKIVARIVKKTTTTWDDVFLEQKVFTRLSHLAPSLVIWFMAGWALKAYPLWLIFVHNLAYVYMVLASTIVILSFIDAWHKIYNTLPIAQHRQIKGYVQLVKILVVVISSLILISVVFKKDISTIVAGLGAMAAVLILVFKDTLLGLVASIQLSANKMVKVGDWITIGGRNIDGTVEDITLNTVKVQNFDKTIVTLPTYALVNESFQNWKGMEEAGIRQIKRSLFIDQRSICFLDARMKERLSRFGSLEGLFVTGEKESGMGTATADTTGTPFMNSDRITNLAVFRYYAELYLRNHPMIDNSQTVIVRHRDPGPEGLPVQVYAFVRNNSFAPYENVQSEIFEHLIAITGEFGLRVFQHPTGDDMQFATSKSVIDS